MADTLKAVVYGNNIDTDAIIAARYLNTSDPEELASHCMEDIDSGFAKKAGKESFDAVAKELLSNKVIVAQYSEGVRQRIIGMYHCGNCQKAD